MCVGGGVCFVCFFCFFLFVFFFNDTATTEIYTLSLHDALPIWHSGFTGTYTWADPEEELIYVFLSNRTYPTASNTLLVKSGLRTRIQQAIYDAIID